MKHIFQNKAQNREDLAKKANKQSNQQLNVAQLQRAIEDPTIENLSPDTMMALQQTHGNQFAAQLTSGTSYPVQAKLTVTEANDSYEQEADAAAKQVVAGMNAPVQRQDEEEEVAQPKRDTLQRQMPEEEEFMPASSSSPSAAAPASAPSASGSAPASAPSAPSASAPSASAPASAPSASAPSGPAMEEEEMMQMKRDKLQRQDIPEDEDELLQAKRSGDMMGGMDVSSDIENQIEQQRGSGQPLPDSVRASMESGFGADFSNVRVHTDSTADNLSRSIQAQAFTTGSDIFFKQGSYDPSSSSGQELLAHELTHTIQQGAAPKEDTNE